MVNLENLPATLCETGLFCVWRYEARDNGEKTKVPYNPRTGARGRSNDRTTFAPLAVAVDAMPCFDGLGVGIFDDLGAIDIDHCIADDGQLSDMARAIVEAMDAYFERSPSGRGIRILFRAPGFTFDKERFYINNQRLGLEIYIAGCTNKYVTVTGDAITPGRDLADRRDALLGVLERYMRRENAATPEPRKAGPGRSSTDWRGKLDAALERKPELRHLYQLAPDPARDDSADDLALMNHLAYWLDGDTEAMRAAFLESARGRRAKAQRRDYQDMTIQAAIRGTSRTAAGEHRAWLAERDTRTKQKVEGTTITAIENEAQNPDDGLARSKDDLSDLGNAIQFKDMFHDRFYFVGAWGWVYWDGKRWKRDGSGEGIDPKEAVKRAYAQMCDRMLREALEDMAKSPNGDKLAEARYAWSKRSRFLKQFSGAMGFAQALMNKAADDFDKRESDLNTPAGIVDLRTGKIRPHDPKAFCTNITEYSPADGPAPLWAGFLDFITAGDKDLQEYLQIVSGMAAVGAVYYEGLLLAYGQGGNGKSTLFNVLQGVLGSYATSIAPEILLANHNRTEVTGLAVAKGKRFIVAAETEEGNRLSESVMKRLTSTDKISARFLYHDPIVFQPTHTLVLCTNHLPKIGSTDHGTWRRIMTVPFVKRVSDGVTPIRDYARQLMEKEGGEILAWIIEGARRFYANGCNIELPTAVVQATEEYKASENWIGNFISECCEVGDRFRETGSNLYATYRQWAGDNGEYVRRPRDFTQALEGMGFQKRATMQAKVWDGIRVTADMAQRTLTYRATAIGMS